MKTKLVAAALFGLTAAAVALVPMLAPLARTPEAPPVDKTVQPAHPGTQAERPVVDALFVLDTTGSMGGLIQAAKDKIWSIASTMARAQPAPQLRMGLVAYRDRGDDYVTRVMDLSPDLDAVHVALTALDAQGGGDGPEDVNQALHDAVHKVAWSQADNAYKVIFLVGDAPPHTDYPNQAQYPEIVAQAKTRGIRVNAIQCGDQGDTASDWQRIAQLGNGSFFRVDQAGGAVAVASPYDERLAKLSAALDETRLYYGSRTERAERDRALAESKAAKAAAAPAALARRAEYMASKDAAAAVYGPQELVEEVASGRVALESVPAAELPEPLAKLDAEERRVKIAQTAAERERIQKEMKDLAAERQTWLAERVKAAGGAEDSLDRQLYETVRSQAAGAGLRYDADGPAY